MEKPYLKKIKKIGQIVVWRVDGQYVREHLDLEFTNFGQHEQFVFIPDNELWLDRENQPGEQEYFIETMLAMRKFLAGGISRAEAVKIADQLEQTARLKNKKVRQLWRHKGEPKTLLEIHERLIKKYCTEGLQVWLVNGELVRGLYFLDFTQGGHHCAYDFIPETEIWIDDDLRRQEYAFVILHELYERRLMRERRMNYDDAHDAANVIEAQARQDKNFLQEQLRMERGIIKPTLAEKVVVKGALGGAQN